MKLLEAEVARLKKELRRSQLEILRKATAYFARNDV